MSATALHTALSTYTTFLAPLTEPQLNTPWTWHGYDEGIRFNAFRVYETLTALAGQLRANQPVTTAQHAMAAYHRTWMHFTTLIRHAPVEIFDIPPVENEHPLRTVTMHVLEGEWSFFAVLDHALTALRTGNPTPPAIPDEFWDPFFVERGGFHLGLATAAPADLLTFWAGNHATVLTAIASVTSAELDTPIPFWEPTPFPIRFRLYRYDSHLLQHTLQVEKARLALGHPPTEAQRLVQHIWQAYADVDSAALIHPNDSALHTAAETITHLYDEVARLI